jgi:hypothetical protein
VDVPAHGTKDVRVTFYAHTVGQTLANVAFRNEQSGEYTFYELKVGGLLAAVSWVQGRSLC